MANITGLNRNLSGCGPAPAACTATRQVSLIEPNTVNEDRLSQLDFRVAKLFRTPYGRFRGALDVFNIFNNAAILARNNTVGAAWGTPTRILSPRLFKLSAQFNF